jgi:predicted AlkP superfamily pyrophosphatase or phosphodiesterase
MMKLKTLSLVLSSFLLVLTFNLKAQTSNSAPKLVVGVIVDQMRYDYITRFWNDYSDDGFKRLISEGFNCENNHFNYAPTYTGPGHASVYTGTTPAVHGIIGNDWYDKESKQMVYCVADDQYRSVGTASTAGQMSPHRLVTTTVTDQLRLHTQKGAKVIGVSVKDRGAVLPAGHMANAAYWFEGKQDGNWISSSYYMDELPNWVKKFNKKKSVSQYKKDWTLLKPIEDYQESVVDANNFEGKFKGESTTSFPHKFTQLWDSNGFYDIIKSSPYGNSLVTDFSIEALKKEELGKGDFTDFLAISYSSTDYVGHMFGVDSKEVQDVYLRLDLEIARLLQTLDEQVGEGNYSLFLSADHGAVQVPAYLQSVKIPAGLVNGVEIKSDIEAYVLDRFGPDLIENISNHQIFLNREKVDEMGYDLKSVQEAIAMRLLGQKDIYKVYTAYQMWQNDYVEGVEAIVQNGYNQKRSGDVMFVYKPAHITYSNYGSTHGSPLDYDTHVPLIFFGKGFNKGKTTARTEIYDIAPTVAAMLKIAFPNGTTGSPIEEVLD